SRPGTAARRAGRELLVFAAFLLMTAAMTWPWVLNLRDAVGDEGDPYMLAWTLWWDYHQTFTDPLNLFHANVFYPHRYALAFSEHDYGIALLFFPLFAAGLRPLTVHSVATFCGFAFSGYGAFRLARTLTKSYGAAWVAGIFFAFVPYRFHVLSHLHYLFAGWVPLLLESLVLFARARTRRRAAWMGVAFLMNALTCVTYFILTLVPLALTVALLATRLRLWRERAFWLRGAGAVGAASLVLLPFMLPYVYVRELYGFERSARELTINSPEALHWLVAEGRNKLWRGLGSNVPDGARHALFPGLVAPLLALAAAFVPPRLTGASGARGRRLLLARALDGLAILSGVVALLAAGYEGVESSVLSEFFGARTASHALALMTAALVARLALGYSASLGRGGVKNLLGSLRAARRGDAFALGVVWAACGFLGSLGANFFLNRVLHDLVPLFRAMRIPSHYAMVAYVGLALLAGLGAQRLAERAAAAGWRANFLSPRARAATVFACLAAVLLFELRAAPLEFARGAVDPDEVTLRIRETPMRGGLLELPIAGEQMLVHRYMLRSADHRKPLINGTSSFVPPTVDRINEYVRGGPIDTRLLDLMEELPASYLVVHASEIPPERRADYETFISQAVRSNRLRYVRSFGARSDLYAVVKTEPEARAEAPLPFPLAAREWGALLEEDPANMLGQFGEWSETVYRMHVASYGELPRYAEFVRDVRELAPGVTSGLAGQEARLRENLRRLASEWVGRERFRALYGRQTAAQFVSALRANAGLAPDGAARDGLAARLDAGELTRADALLEVASDAEFARRESNRAQVLLHYFGYLRRDPGDPPDRDLAGFQFWVNHLEQSGDRAGLNRAFMAAGEYKDRKK
ncbi:MAG TPA: hypothetical protein VER32_08540, partial [Pyrinomonadaceae bacterium]|nr:hypothetical protein [Pyrinomonadaceae bacterium]